MAVVAEVAVVGPAEEAKDEVDRVAEGEGPHQQAAEPVEKDHQQGMHAGPRSAECTCPSCDTKVPHQPGIPCFDRDCPNCGARMIRK